MMGNIMDNVYEFTVVTDCSVFEMNEDVHPGQDQDLIVLEIDNKFNIQGFPSKSRIGDKGLCVLLRNLLNNYAFMDYSSRLLLDDEANSRELSSYIKWNALIRFDRRSLVNSDFLVNVIDQGLFLEGSKLSLSKQMQCKLNSKYHILQDVEDHRRVVIFFQIYRLRNIFFNIDNDNSQHLLTRDEYEFDRIELQDHYSSHDKPYPPFAALFRPDRYFKLLLPKIPVAILPDQVDQILQFLRRENNNGLFPINIRDLGPGFEHVQPVLSSLEVQENQTKCSICIYDFAETPGKRILDQCCSHQHHLECLLDWFVEKSRRPDLQTCPLCKGCGLHW